MKLLFSAIGVLTLVVPQALAQRRSDRGAQVWSFLAKKYDKNGDHKITKEEYARGGDKFAAFDSNHDGFLTEADWERGGGRRGGAAMRARFLKSMLATLAKRADADSDKTVTRAEWKQFVAAKVHEGSVDIAALLPSRSGAARGRMARMVDFVESGLDTDKDGSVSAAELGAVFARLDTDKNGILAGTEFGRSRQRRAPAKIPQPGQEAPDFDLPIVGNTSQTIRLSSFRGKRPVALIFGSYT